MSPLETGCLSARALPLGIRPIMKFGNRLLEQLHQPWAAQYLPYNELKQILKKISPSPTDEGVAAEGEFLSAVLAAVRMVDGFFAAQEDAYVRRLAELAHVLAAPSSWILMQFVTVREDGVDLSQLVEGMVEGVHVPAAQKVALDSFLALCAEIDVLRKFSVLNSLAVTKLLKKHDKYSSIKLSTTVLDFVKAQSFTTSRRLAATFTHAQCIASEIISAVTTASPDFEDYTCSICLDVLSMPVVLPCTHRFCYGCLSEAALHNHVRGHCPLCKKETDLDPSHYEIDPVLSRFVKSHFRRSPSSAGSPSPPLDSPTQPLAPPKLPVARVPASMAAKLEAKLEASSTLQIPKHLSVAAGAPSGALEVALLMKHMHAATLGQQYRGLPCSGLLVPRAVGTSLEPSNLLANAVYPLCESGTAETAVVCDGEQYDAAGGEEFDGAAEDWVAAAAAAIEEASTNPDAKRARKRACFECHRAKAACEGEPCNRCTRLGKTCFTQERKKRRRRGGATPAPVSPTPDAQAAAPDLLSLPPLVSTQAAMNITVPQAFGVGAQAPCVSPKPRCTGEPSAAAELQLRSLAPQRVSLHARRVPSAPPVPAPPASPGDRIANPESATYAGAVWPYLQDVGRPAAEYGCVPKFAETGAPEMAPPASELCAWHAMDSDALEWSGADFSTFLSEMS